MQNNIRPQLRESEPSRFLFLMIHLLEKGHCRDTDQQLSFEEAAYAQVSTAAKRAWNKILSSGGQTEDLSRIRHGSDELFQDFVSQLMQISSRLAGDAEAGLLIVEQLAYGNANTVCQAALRPFRERGDTSDIIWICSDIGPSYTQGLAMAAALWEFQLKIFYFNKKNQGPGRRRTTESPRNCFGCGQKGQQVRQWPDRGVGKGPGCV